MGLPSENVEEVKELKRIFSDPYALQYSKRFWETCNESECNKS